MSADIDRVMAEAAREREQLIAALAAADAAKHAATAKAARWTVVRQYGHMPDDVVSTHRWAWLAEWAARRGARRSARRHSAAYRAHYTVRRAAS